MRELLKIVTCGSVDDGKSTLIGHLMYNIRAVFTDQQAELEQKTERLATLTEELNQAAIEAKKNAPEKQRTCYFERAKLKKEAFKDSQKTAKPKERSQNKNEIE